jgi:hypothetical protein
VNLQILFPAVTINNELTFWNYYQEFLVKATTLQESPQSVIELIGNDK